ncbi:RDD family protein [Aquibacillus halophilus]|uniref:RDD family protein n=1 Tax=Aquibacillus halophilus TaxID=930132 RepID=A0A6A8D761_9BACI|nr:RDD family protein [Aquibacillus halophilus]MRH41414.1 RDD family protein [Aquibacillus halophilus]
MKSVLKKRMKAYLIDIAISTAVTVGVEYLLRKKIKSEAFHALVTPTTIMWSLEFLQLRKSGQTIGYKKMGLVLTGEEGTELTSSQIINRMVYRDTVSTFDYLKNAKAFEDQEGEVLPHDRYARTVVRDRGTGSLSQL